MNAAILRRIDHQHAIPTPPDVVTRLIEITSDPNYKHTDLVKLLSSDAGTASALLRLANSSLFRGIRETASVSEAIVRLGVRQVRSLVLGRGMIATLAHVAPPWIDLRYFWRRSVATAVLTARFADHLVQLPRDQAFTGGLLCDAGVIILATAVPESYAPIAKAYATLPSRDLLTQERDRLKLTHADVSAEALHRWGLPETACEAVRCHHDRQFAGLTPQAERLASALNACGEMARCLCENSDRALIRGVFRAALERIGANTTTALVVLSQVEADVQDLAGALGVDVIPNRVYKIVSEAIAEEAAGGAEGLGGA